ncbi:MAG: penicillin-binding protein 2 [Planctomycetota bacterium]
MRELDTARTRFVRICLGLGLLLVLLGGRLFHLQVLRHDLYAADARRYHQTVDVEPAARGGIFDVQGQPLAVSKKTMTLTVDPVAVGDLIRKQELADLLVELGVPQHREELLERLYGTRRYVVLERRIEDQARVEYIRRRLHEDGFQRAVRFEVEYKRDYPLGRDAVHLVGVLGVLKDNRPQGLWGIERQFEKVLRGKAGRWDWERDAVGRRRFTGGLDPEAVEPGADVVLTIDANLQSVLVGEMRKSVEKYGAQGASGVLLDPRSGRILAMASLPDLDPEDRGKITPSQIRNRAISSNLGPGSSFKPFIMAAALDAGVISPSTTINCEGGRARFGSRTIKDTHGHGVLPLEEILVFSSNIGMAKIALMLGRERIYAAERAFGFGSKTGIRLPQEESGLLWPLSQWSRNDNYSTASHGYGQEIGVTPLQLALAYAAIANGGFRIEPRIVEHVLLPDGSLHEPKLAPPERILSVDTARRVRDMCLSVLEHEDGSNKKLAIPGYRCGGKTGTFEIMKKGVADGHVSTFACFGPMPEPTLVCVIMVERPDVKKGHYGGVVAGPAVKATLAKTFEYLLLPKNVNELGPR